MAKIHSMMDIGKRSMQNSQTALQTVSHNIANKNTEGFSRQRIEVQTSTPHTEGRLQMGTGSTTAAITRTVNPWLEKQLQREGGNSSYLETKSDALSRIEQVFNEQQNKGLNSSMSDFFNSFRELSNNPESLAARTMVKESAEVLSNDFKRVSRQLNDVTIDLDKQIEGAVGDINQISKEIANLNEKVQANEIGGGHANDERDRRDLLLRKLSEKVNISWAEGKTGMVNVTAGNTAILVSGSQSSELSTMRRAGDERVQVFYSLNSTGTKTDLTDQFSHGTLGSAIQVRDQNVLEMKKSVNEIAYNLATEVNKAHIEGFDRYSGKGILFFDMPQGVETAADEIQVNKSILGDVGKIAAASQVNSPADNTTANVIHSLQYQQTMQNGTSTFDDYYNSKVGEIGIVTQRTRESFESQKNIVDQLNNIRESISGVSLDEEATKMIEYQKAYEASARVIKMADEMFDTVLNLKRM